MIVPIYDELVLLPFSTSHVNLFCFWLDWDWEEEMNMKKK